MCEPTTIALVATGMNMASTVVGQGQAEDRYSQAKANARTSANINQAAVNTRISQERVSTAQRVDELSLQADALRSATRTSAASGGVTGLSIQELQNDVSLQEARSSQALMTSLGFKETQLHQEKRAIGINAANQASQFMPTTTLGGGLLAAGITGLGLYSTGRALEK